MGDRAPGPGGAGEEGDAAVEAGGIDDHHAAPARVLGGDMMPDIEPKKGVQRMGFIEYAGIAAGAYGVTGWLLKKFNDLSTELGLPEPMRDTRHPVSYYATLRAAVGAMLLMVGMLAAWVFLYVLAVVLGLEGGGGA